MHRPTTRELHFVETTALPGRATALLPPARVGGICALLALVTFTIGVIAGGLAQPDAFSFANDDISPTGAVTANSPWLHNQVASNLSGLLIVLAGLALWRVFSPDILGRIGAATLVAGGISLFSDGFLRLDCNGVDVGCENVSWHAHAHKSESNITGTLLFAAPFVLAFAFRRSREWRGAWLPTLLAVPAALAIGILVSALGPGAAQRATNWTWFVWLAFLGVWLLQGRSRGAPAMESCAIEQAGFVESRRMSSDHSPYSRAQFPPSQSSAGERDES
jgi:Protein of unknown function (DUF998)